MRNRVTQQGGLQEKSLCHIYLEELDSQTVIMTNGEIVTEVVRLGVIDHALSIYHVHTSHREDMMQEVAMILLSIEEARLNDIYQAGKISHFVTRIVRNQWRSKTSTYYAKFRKYEEKKATNELNGIADRCYE